MGRDPFAALPGAVRTSTLPLEAVELYYNYNWLEEDQRQVAQEAARNIKRIARRVQGELLQVARILLDVKEQGLFPTRQFGEWVEVEFGIRPRKAQLMMNVAREYHRPDDLPLVVEMGDTVAMLVAQPSVPGEARATIERRVAAGEPVRVDEAKTIIRDSKQGQISVAHAIEIVRNVMRSISDEAEVENLLTGPQEDLLRVVVEETGSTRPIGRVALGAAARTILQERRRKLSDPAQSTPVSVSVPRWVAERAASDLAGDEREEIRILWRSIQQALR